MSEISPILIVGILPTTWAMALILKGHLKGNTLPESGWRRKYGEWAANLFGGNVRGCGCVHDIGFGDRSPGASVKSRETGYVRVEDGARIKFKLVEEQLCRCHRCGRHYHRREGRRKDGFPHQKIVSCWEEEEWVFRQNELEYPVIS